VIEIRNLTVAFGGVRGLNDLSADIGAKITGLGAFAKVDPRLATRPKRVRIP